MDQECCSQLVQWGEACTTLVCPVRCSAGQAAEKQIEGSCGVLVLPPALQAPRGQP